MVAGSRLSEQTFSEGGGPEQRSCELRGPELDIPPASISSCNVDGLADGTFVVSPGPTELGVSQVPISRIHRGNLLQQVL